jgi:hypothetical protein
MPGKKKTMEGGILGMITKNYSKENINSIASKIIYGKYKQNSMWIDRKLNNQRAEQRINAFFKKLSEELKILSNTRDRIMKLYNYFKDIVKKYPEEIKNMIKKEIIGGVNNTTQKYDGDFFTAYYYFLENGYITKFDELQNIFQKFKKNKVPVINSNLPKSKLNNPNLQKKSLENNNNKQKLEKYNIIYKNFIDEFDEWYGRDSFKNFRDNKTITIPVQKKYGLFRYIIDLVDRIYDLGKHYSLPEYKDILKLKSLKEKLSILKKLYESVFINNPIINKNQEIYANRYEEKNKNLNQKYKNLFESLNI